MELYEWGFFFYIIIMFLLALTTSIAYILMLRRRLFKSMVSMVHHSVDTSGTFNKEEIFKSEIYGKLLAIAEGKKERVFADGDWDLLYKELEKCGGGFIMRLKSAGRYSQTELRVSILIKLGFRPKEIALVVCKSKESVTSIRRRLSAKILNTPFPTPKQWDDFVLSL